MPSARKTYDESGDFSPLGLLAVGGLLALPAIAIALALGGLNYTPMSLVIVMPGLAGAGLGYCGMWLFQQAHCRNRLLAALVTGAWGVVAYLGQFHAMLIFEGGWEMIPRIDLTPAALVEVVNSWTIGGNAGPNRRPEPVANWILFAVELAACSGAAGFIAYTKLRRAYCERCGCWMNVTEAKLMFPEAQVLTNALRGDGMESLPKLMRVRDPSASHAVVTIENCNHLDGSPPSWYVSVAAVNVNGQGPYSTTAHDELATHVELTKMEVQVLAQMLPELFPSLAQIAQRV